ncbi:cyclophilin-like protein [Saitoella complicata NRRL Y-17804]|uniref:cyclophilin-like protein n=1 Tax=Saitoella complicata (strain BCRC 22490 / CBS 7301 / JCM 7358 / NBRC 10748 / NRRL Y-17804) TaxID=698492 RepID=UPI00086735D0|nr:cyclophilin-like protein [Saitoella complicata NRRL Y-17804]ODQ53102.1 cyclophilin-like protein [Saitoella complicata NRRL Y-17804]
MASLYNIEPPTEGKVILHTTKGDLEIELWSKECPKACRNFIQLCLEGYYDNTIFHRIVPNFIVQGGDPTGTGTGGQSIWDVPFEDEFHTRIRYNRRGLVGMANSGKDDNGSQFFFTLGETPELTGKNTLFGRMVGDTIYNLLRISQLETDADERPLYPAKITSASVVINPFPDIVPRSTAAERAAQADALKKTEARKKKGTKNKTLLSFAGEEGEEEEVEFKPKGKGKSAHDVLDDKRLAKKVAVDVDALPERQPEKQESKTVEVQKPTLPKIAADEPAPAAVPKKDDLASQIEALKSSIRGLDKRDTEDSRPAKKAKVSALEEERAKYMQRSKAIVGGRKRRRGEDDTLAALNMFQSKLHTAAPSKKEEEVTQAPEMEVLCELHQVPKCMSCFDRLGEQNDEDPSTANDWLTHELVFEKDRLGKDGSTRQKKGEENLVVIDPREKAAALKEAGKAKKDERKGVWKQDRGGGGGYDRERGKNHDRERPRHDDRDQDRHRGRR